jgi:hypothetical protein
MTGRGKQMPKPITITPNSSPAGPILPIGECMPIKELKNGVAIILYNYHQGAQVCGQDASGHLAMLIKKEGYDDQYISLYSTRAKLLKASNGLVSQGIKKILSIIPAFNNYEGRFDKFEEDSADWKDGYQVFTIENHPNLPLNFEGIYDAAQALRSAYRPNFNLYCMNGGLNCAGVVAEILSKNGIQPPAILVAGFEIFSPAKVYTAFEDFCSKLYKEKLNKEITQNVFKPSEKQVLYATLKGVADLFKLELLNKDENLYFERCSDFEDQIERLGLNNLKIILDSAKKDEIFDEYNDDLISKAYRFFTILSCILDKTDEINKNIDEIKERARVFIEKVMQLLAEKPKNANLLKKLYYTYNRLISGDFENIQNLKNVCASYFLYLKLDDNPNKKSKNSANKENEKKSSVKTLDEKFHNIMGKMQQLKSSFESNPKLPIHITTENEPAVYFAYRVINISKELQSLKKELDIELKKKPSNYEMLQKSSTSCDDAIEKIKNVFQESYAPMRLETEQKLNILLSLKSDNLILVKQGRRVLNEVKKLIARAPEEEIFLLTAVLQHVTQRLNQPGSPDPAKEDLHLLKGLARLTNTIPYTKGEKAVIALAIFVTILCLSALIVSLAFFGPALIPLILAPFLAKLSTVLASLGLSAGVSSAVSIGIVGTGGVVSGVVAGLLNSSPLIVGSLFAVRQKRALFTELEAFNEMSPPQEPRSEEDRALDTGSTASTSTK